MADGDSLRNLLPCKRHKWNYKTEDVLQTGIGTARHSMRYTEFDWSKCLFCQKVTHRKNQETIAVKTDGQNIKDVAQEKHDFKLLAHIQLHDLSHMGAKYHHGCHSGYMTKSNRRKRAAAETVKTYDSCFLEVMYTFEPALESDEVISLKDLLETFRNKLKSSDVSSFESYRADRLKSRLQKYFGDKVTFQMIAENKEIVYLSTLSVADVLDVTLINQETPEITEDRHINQENKIEKLAKELHQEIKNIAGIDINPVNIEDLNFEKSHELIPASLYNLICLLITGKKASEGQSDEAKSRRVIAVCHSIIYAASNSRAKMPTQVSLAMTMHHLTRSKHLITILNRLGLGLSYDDVEYAETSIANSALDKSEEHGIVIPSNIDGQHFIQMAADNIDLKEKTIDGKSITHATTMVVIQHGSFGSTSGRTSLKQTVRERSITSKRAEITKNDLRYLQRKSKIPEHYCSIAYDCFKSENDVNLLDFAWKLIQFLPTRIAKLDTDEEFKVSHAWTAFHASFIDAPDDPVPDTIGYCSIIPTPSTDYNTIYTVMENAQKIVKGVGQKDCVITFDLAIYSKAKEVQWQYSEFENVVIRLGTFHILLNYLSTMGKLFNDAGLEDWLVEANIYGSGTASAAIDGKDYNYAIRCYTLLAVALFSLQWDRFTSSIPDLLDIQTIHDRIFRVQQEIVNDNSKCIQKLLDECLHSVNEAYENFREQESSKDNTFRFFNLLINMVQIMHDFIKAERSGDWNLHLATTVKSLAYFFAMDRQNYSRWLPIYIIDMKNLPSSHPAVYEQFQIGNHSVGQTGKKFVKVPTDMALEQSINLDTKTIGGIVGISQNTTALAKWFLTYHERARITKSLKTMCGLVNSLGTYKDSKSSRKEKDKIDVESLVTVVKEGIIVNPFDAPIKENSGTLINIATGTMLPQDVTAELLECHELGVIGLKKYFEWLQDDKFWSPIPQQKIKTFSSTIKKPKPSTTERAMNISADRDLFARLLVVATARSIDLKHLLTYELNAVPYSIAHADGSLRKVTNKSDLLKNLEKHVEVRDSLPSSSPNQSDCLIIDAMTVVRSIPVNNLSTFGDLSDRLYRSFTGYFSSSVDRIDCVFDVYKTDSIKSDERRRRGSSNMPNVKILGPKTPLPKRFPEYLLNENHKQDLCNFISSFIVNKASEELEVAKSLVITWNDEVYVVKIGLVEKRQSLQSDQEEADTRLMLHAKDAANVHDRIIIKSVDSDIDILALHHLESIGCQEVWFLTGKGHTSRAIPIHELANELDPHVIRSMVGLHLITGCDTTSGLLGITKKTALEVFKESPKILTRCLQMIGNTIPIQENTIKDVEAFISRLYTQRNVRSVDEVRYLQFACKGQKNEQLPPTSATLRLHIIRANYQAYIWKNALLGIQNIPPAVGIVTFY